MQRHQSLNARRVFCLLATCGLLSSGAMAQGVGGSTSQREAAVGAGETPKVVDAWGNEVAVARQPRRGAGAGGAAGGAGGGGAGEGGGQVEGEERRRAIVLRGQGDERPIIELTIDADGGIEVSELIERLTQLSPHGLQFRVDQLSQRPSLGVVLSDADPVLLQHLRLETDSAVLIERVLPGSPAMRAGLSANDLVLSIDGETVQGVEDFRTRIGAWDGQGPIAFEVVRRGQKLTLSVTPARRDAQQRGLVIDTNIRIDTDAALREATERLRKALDATSRTDLRGEVAEAIEKLDRVAKSLAAVRAQRPGWPEAGLQGFRFVDPETGEYRLFELPSHLFREVPAERLRELRSEDLYRLRAIPGGSGVAERFELRASPQAERLERLEASVERLESKLDRLLEKLSDR